jgi:hypothetical protein
MRKCGKNFTKCLIFNDLLYSASLSASFPHPFRILSAMRKTFDFQRFANITQTLDLSTLFCIFAVRGGGSRVGC